MDILLILNGLIKKIESVFLGVSYNSLSERRYKVIALQGKGASNGEIIGKACIIESISDFSKVREGDIIIVHSSSPAWTIPMLQAGALVSELGGIICHIAIMAREMGIPCVVGVNNIFDYIKDGCIVEVNGETGEVRINE